MMTPRAVAGPRGGTDDTAPAVVADPTRTRTIVLGMSPRLATFVRNALKENVESGAAYPLLEDVIAEIDGQLVDAPAVSETPVEPSTAKTVARRMAKAAKEAANA